MRALSCLADWQHDSTLTPNTETPHPNDAILKRSLCSCTNPIHKYENLTDKDGQRDGDVVLISSPLCTHVRGK